MKKIIVAIDSFKGCLTSAEANINPPNLPLEIALQPTTAKENIRQTIAQSFDEF